MRGAEGRLRPSRVPDRVGTLRVLFLGVVRQTLLALWDWHLEVLRRSVRQLAHNAVLLDEIIVTVSLQIEGVYS